MTSAVSRPKQAIVFKKGCTPWNRGVTKYSSIKNNLEYLASVKRLTDKQISEALKCPKSTITYLRKRFDIKTVSEWERWKSKELTQLQKDLLIGTLLGDGYSRYPNTKHANITISQSLQEYTRWKFDILKNWCKNSVMRSRGEFRFGTISHPVFDRIYDLFYINGKKKLRKELLNEINDFALAVWFMDDGTICRSVYRGKRKTSVYFNLQLRTDSFNFKEHSLIKEWFKEKYDIEVKICKYKNNKGKPKYYITFNTLNKKKFIEIVKPFILPFFRYKINN